jgi:Domain of unknown function (DUF1840)
MLFKFKSKAASDLIMLEADARKLLQIMLGDDSVKGIVLAKDIPRCITALQEAVLQDEAARKRLAEKAACADDGDDSDGVVLDAVRLSQRATPMLKLLERSRAEASDVVWGV